MAGDFANSPYTLKFLFMSLQLRRLLLTLKMLKIIQHDSGRRFSVKMKGGPSGSFFTKQNFMHNVPGNMLCGPIGIPELKSIVQ